MLWRARGLRVTIHCLVKKPQFRKRPDLRKCNCHFEMGLVFVLWIQYLRSERWTIAERRNANALARRSNGSNG
jgi:hypothetical protein